MAKQRYLSSKRLLKLIEICQEKGYSIESNSTIIQQLADELEVYPTAIRVSLLRWKETLAHREAIDNETDPDIVRRWAEIHRSWRNGDDMIIAARRNLLTARSVQNYFWATPRPVPLILTKEESTDPRKDEIVVAAKQHGINYAATKFKVPYKQISAWVLE